MLVHPELVWWASLKNPIEILKITVLGHLWEYTHFPLVCGVLVLEGVSHNFNVPSSSVGAKAHAHPPSLPPSLSPVCVCGWGGVSQLRSVGSYTTQAVFSWKEWPDVPPPSPCIGFIGSASLVPRLQLQSESYFRYFRAESSRRLWWLLRSPFKRKKTPLPSMWTVSAQWRLLALCKIGHLWWQILSCYSVTYLITLFSF